MNWQVKYLPEARDDLVKLDGAQRVFVRKAIQKVSQNPLPINEGGYGKPLGNTNTTKLSGFLKIKLKKIGIRVVYSVERKETEMLVIIIGVRADDEVYEEAQSRRLRHKLLRSNLT